MAWILKPPSKTNVLKASFSIEHLGQWWKHHTIKTAEKLQVTRDVPVR